ncbi:hypothetical protein CCYA_CCYA04G1384 [Cyanidiococcus yangmingshanensis]|nr:hypothetical protein CCYA_CCYA04G1384 [Cyanidiococcus yangmingshanensis]
MKQLGVSGDGAFSDPEQVPVEDGFSESCCSCEQGHGLGTGHRERAGVLALAPDARAVLAVTSRHQHLESEAHGECSRQSPRYILPAGGIETGETAAAAACREAYEEAGARVQLLRPLVRHCSSCEPLQPKDSMNMKATLRRPAVTFWFLGRVQELLPEEHGQWPEAGLRQRCYLPLADFDETDIPNHRREALATLRAALGWRADTRAAIEAFLALYEQGQVPLTLLDSASNTWSENCRET